MRRCVLFLIAGSLCGCSDAPQPQPQPQQQPRQDAASQAKAPASETEQPDFDNPLIRSVGQLLDNSVGEEADVGGILMEADSIFSDIKEENEAAIKAVNRQVRVGGALPPNLLLILLDDVGYGELGCFGGPGDPTPYTDAFAAGGVRFSDFYAGADRDDGSWWCLLTGQDTSRAARGQTSSFALQPQLVTLAEMLWQAGYKTGFTGRWGLGTDGRSMPHLHGFDEWFGLLQDESSPGDPLQHLFSNGARASLVSENGQDPNELVMHALVSESVSYLSRQSRESPFLLVSSLPMLVSAGQSRAKQLAEVDVSVGRILAGLRQNKLADNTVVFLLSDNGAEDASRGGDSESRPNGGLRGGKGTLYEGGIRTPLIVRWPGRAQAGRVVPHPFAVWDLMPTLADIAGASRRPRRLDGISMVPALLGKPVAERKLMYWESRQQGLAQAVRSGRWKVVRQSGRMAKEDVELYDLQADPGETTNIAADHPDVVAEFIR